MSPPLLRVVAILTLTVLACTDDHKSLLEVHLSQGDRFLDKGDYARARLDFEQARQLAPGNERATMGLRAAIAGSLVSLDTQPANLSLSLEVLATDFRAASKLTGIWRPLYLVALARVLEWQKEPDKASVILREALLESPKYGSAYYHLGRIQALQGRLEAAERILARGHSRVSNDPKLAIGYGRLLFARKKYEEAATVLRPSASTSSDVSVVWLFAEALRHTKRDKEAVPMMERTLELDPEHALALSELGLVRLRNKQHDAAAALFDRYLSVATERREPRERISLVTRLRRSLSTRQPISAPSGTAAPDSKR